MHMTTGKKKITCAALLLAAVLLLPAFAGAYNHGGGRGQGDGYHGGKQGRGGICRLWRNPDAVEKLGLTDEQVKGLRDADFAFREKQEELRAKMGRVRLGLDRAFSADSVDENTVRQLTKEMAGLKGEMHIQRMESRLAAQKLLNADQLKKVRAWRMERGDRSGKGGKRKGCGMRGLQGNDY